MNYKTRLVNKDWLTHDVVKLTLKKPKSYDYKIGQALELALDKKHYKFECAPFTITSNCEEKFIELIVKVYPKHKGITAQIAQLVVNDKLIISEAWDSYFYKGKGVFIAAGSGITPFIPMIRNLYFNKNLNGHVLIYANKTSKDIILYKELKTWLKDNFFNILSQDHLSGHEFGRINKKYLSEKINILNQEFYICGPEPFSDSVKNDLLSLNVKENLIQIGY